MSKKFEYVDDNPGSYFGMLVENWENLNEDKKNLRNWIEKKVGKQMSSMKPTKIGYKHGRPYYSVDFVDGTSDDYFIDFDKKEIEKCESLKEDSEYKTLAKLSNGLEVISYPYGYAVSDGYVTDRFVVRDGKYIFDDGRFRLSDKDKGKILSLIKKGVIEESLKESYSKSDLYSALEYMYGFNKKEANDWIKKASDKMKQSVVDGWKGNAKKSALTDSLKEDKFVSRDKMSKKAQKELNDKKRGTWGSTNPVTKVQPNKKAYDRKRDKKELDEAKHFLYKENANKFREAYEYVQKIADEMLWDSKKKEIDYEDALYYYNKLKEATKMVYNSFIGDDNYDPYEDGNIVLRG